MDQHAEQAGARQKRKLLHSHGFSPKMSRYVISHGDMICWATCCAQPARSAHCPKALIEASKGAAQARFWTASDGPNCRVQYRREVPVRQAKSACPGYQQR